MRMACTIEKGSLPIPDVKKEEDESVGKVEIKKWKWYEIVVLGIWYVILIAWLAFFFSLA